MKFPTCGCGISAENLWSPMIGQCRPSAICTLICCFTPVCGLISNNEHVEPLLSKTLNLVTASLNPAAFNSCNF